MISVAGLDGTAPKGTDAPGKVFPVFSVPLVGLTYFAKLSNIWKLNNDAKQVELKLIFSETLFWILKQSNLIKFQTLESLKNKKIIIKNKVHVTWNL